MEKWDRVLVRVGNVAWLGFYQNPQLVAKLTPHFVSKIAGHGRPDTAQQRALRNTTE